MEKVFQGMLNSPYILSPRKFFGAFLKVIVTVKSSGCLQIGFGPLIIDYISNCFICLKPRTSVSISLTRCK